MVFGLRETHWRVGYKHVTLHGVPYRTIHIASFPKTHGTAGNDGAYSNNPPCLVIVLKRTARKHIDFSA